MNIPRMFAAITKLEKDEVKIESEIIKLKEDVIKIKAEKEKK